MPQDYYGLGDMMIFFIILSLRLYINANLNADFSNIFVLKIGANMNVINGPKI